MRKDSETSNTTVNVNTSKKCSIFVTIFAVIITIIGTLYIEHNYFQPKDNDPEIVEEETEQVFTITESYLEEILYISDLSTVDYAYSAVATAYAEGGETVMYYVAYDGTVTAGMDFNEIKVNVDADNKIITITLPDCEIQNITVEFESMEYIFTEDKYETETVSTDAYALCEQDLNERVSEEEHILEMAQSSAEDAVEALMRPWIEQAYQDYTLNIV